MTKVSDADGEAVENNKNPSPEQIALWLEECERLSQPGFSCEPTTPPHPRILQMVRENWFDPALKVVERSESIDLRYSPIDDGGFAEPTQWLWVGVDTRGGASYGPGGRGPFGDKNPVALMVSHGGGFTTRLWLSMAQAVHIAQMLLRSVGTARGITEERFIERAMEASK